jgi:hypothetical protein
MERLPVTETKQCGECWKLIDPPAAMSGVARCRCPAPPASTGMETPGEPWECPHCGFNRMHLNQYCGRCGLWPDRTYAPATPPVSETPSCEWCNGHPDFNGPHGNGACAPYRAVALPVSGTEPTPEHTRLLADAMTTRYPAAPAPVSPDIGVLIDEYREACAFATEAGINLPTKAAGAVNAQINARIALDAAVASLVERVERAERKEVTAVRYREITGCAHAIHEECPRCICPTCGTRAVQSRELGWLPFSERLAALTPTPETSHNG